MQLHKEYETRPGLNPGCLATLLIFLVVLLSVQTLRSSQTPEMKGSGDETSAIESKYGRCKKYVIVDIVRFSPEYKGGYIYLIVTVSVAIYILCSGCYNNMYSMFAILYS